MRAASVDGRGCRHDGAAGFTLIEVLIAVIILSIGLLGVASLQLTSKRGNFEAMQRVSATMYAEDLIERMRTNPGVLGTYVTSTVRTFTTDSAPPSAPDCSTQLCSSVAIANFDLVQWWDQIAGASEGGLGGLVSPTACLSRVTQTQYIVAIAWRGMDEISDTASSAGPAELDAARDCGRGGGLYDLTGTTSFRRFITLQAYTDRFAG